VHRPRRSRVPGNDDHDQHDRDDRHDRHHEYPVDDRGDRDDQRGRDHVGGPAQPPCAARTSFPPEWMSEWGRGVAPPRPSPNSYELTTYV